MKENTNLHFRDNPISYGYISEAIVRHLLMAVLGFLSTKAQVMGSMLPFGLSVMAGVGKTFYPSVATGVFIGYFFPAISQNGFRYIASLFAILAIKVMLSPYKKISENPLFLSGITLGATAITNTLSLTGTPADTLTFLCESFLSAGGAYFVSRSYKALSRKTVGLSTDEMASLLITINILLLGLGEIKFYGISFGKTVGIVLILVASKYGGTLSGAVSGIAVSFASALSTGYNSSFFSYSLGGLITGIFMPLGRYAQCAAIVATVIIDSAIGGFSSDFFPALAEAILGCILFLIIPKKFATYIGKVFSLCPKIGENKGIKQALNIRLEMAANALREVSSTTEKVSAELSKINTPDFGHILNKIEDESCKGCNKRTFCWEKNRNLTVDAILDITKSVKGITPENDNAINELKSRCIRFSRLNESAIKRYTEYMSSLASENRIDEVREVVCNQFYGISDMLIELSKDLQSEESFNQSVALAVAAALKNLEIHAEETSAKTDKYGRTTVTVKVKSSPEIVLNKKEIMKICSLACELQFDIPLICENKDGIYITLSEHAIFKAEVGVEQLSANENIISGDAYNYFNDGKGHLIMILSDGMGTGGRAAVDGAMASGLMADLLKAGFGYNCSLKLLNSSMLFKSSDESSATLDIAAIDLFTGEVNLYKAGAAPTLVKRSGNCGKAVSTSLPIGILENVSFDTARIKLKDNDVILLLSDGAVSDGTDWIKAELESFKDGTAQELAERICGCAKRRQREYDNDDITVMAAILEKAV